MRKKFKSFISVFLALLMIIQVMPMSTFAKDDEQKQAIEASKPLAEDNDDDIVIETEIESMRTENSKTFLTADNEFYQVTSLKPIHDYNGKEWIDKIDCEDLSISNTDDVENYIDLQAESTQDTDNLVQSNEVTIDSTGEKIIGNCEALIKTYSTENDISVRNVIDRFGTMIGEIYVKPYFPQDHSIFVTKATINMNIDKVVERYNLLAVNRLNADLESYNGSNVFASDSSKNYDLVEIYRGDDGKACSFDFTDYCHYTNLGFYENNGVAIIPDGTVDVSFDENITVSICYHEIDDLDSRYEYENVDLGRAGNVYINDYTCAPTLIRNELSLYSEIAPVTIQTIFNPMADISDSGLGEHTRINYYSTLQYDDISDIYLWMNCEGENIVLTKKVYTNYYEGISANGNKFRLYGFNSDRNNYSDIYIVNIENNENQWITEKNKYYFSSHNNIGYLKKILDASANRNSIIINYSEIDGSKYAITNIIDGNNRKYILTYENGYLKNLSVYNSDNEQISINNIPLQVNYKYENGLLKKVKYSDNKVIEYVYGTDSKLKNIKNIDGSLISFSYEIKFNNESYKLTSYEITDANNNTVEEVTISGIEKSIYSRIFSNSNYSNNKELMFDKSFNLTSIQNYNGVKYYLDYADGSLDYIINTDFSENANLIRNGEFENCEDTGLPTDWEYNLGYGSTAIQRELDLDDTVNRNNEKTLNLQNSNLLKCEAYQIINNYNNSSFLGGQSYIISGAAYRNEKPISSNDLRTFCIMVYDTAEDANGQLSPNNCLMKLDFDDTLKQKWQERKAIFTIKENTSALLVYLCYNNMTSTCDFDSIELYPVTTSNSIKADAIIPSTDVSYDYSENNSILEEIKTTVDGDELGALYNYTDNENYISKITNNGVPTYYNYDNNNGLLLSKGSNSETSKNAQFAYSPVGLLESVKQAVTLIDSGSTVNINTNYTYENDRIKTVEHNNCIYEYEYDASGRVTGINEYSFNTQFDNTSINKNNIVSYQYTNNEIGTISYGNGAKVLYEYNQFGYITKITFVPAPEQSSNEDGDQADLEESTEQTADPIVYEYTYDENGNVVSYTDHSNDTVLTIENDVYTIKEAGENGKILYQKNGNNRIVFGNKTTTVNTKLTSSSGKITDSKVFNLYAPGKLLPANTVSASTVYDSVGRTFETIATDLTATVKNESTYITKGITTSNLVHTYISSVTRLQDASEPRIYRKLTYSYNDRGQITDVYRASVNIIPENIENTSTSTNSLKNEILKHYEYDEAGQVILDVNMDSFKAIKYKYNEGGNLVSKTIYQNEDSNDKSAFYYKKSTGKYIFNDSEAVTKSYEYSSDWSDVLTKYNNKTIEYDNIGNPTKYFGENVIGEDVSGTMTWDGTRLTSFDDGDYKYIYKYSADGFRTQKTMYKSNSDTVVTQMDYIYENDNLAGIRTRVYDPKGPEDEEQPLTHEVVTNIISNSTNEAVGLDIQITAFNQEVEKNGVTKFEDVTTKVYFYILRDGQGNITDMYNSTEDIVLHFSYDAYGNCDLTFSGNILHDILTQLQGSSGWRKVLQAFVYSLVLGLVVGGTMGTTQQTYKGYVCDYETGLYYSQNRFYSPSWGRFINADDPNMLAKSQGEVFGANLFNYCNNDPVNNVDLSGYAPTSYDTSANILSALNIDQLNTIQVGVVPSKLHGKVKNEMTIFGLSLATVKDEDDKKYWNRVFGTTENIVQKNNGNNYMDTVISKQSGAATMYDLKPSTSPYKIGE